MKNVLTFIKKEFLRFFTDRRMVITIFLPGILIFALYSIMGSVFTETANSDEDYKPSVYAVNMPETLSGTISLLFEVTEDEMTEEQAKAEIAEGALDIAVIFPENFEETLASSSLSDIAPDVRVWYNSTETNSYTGYVIMQSVLSSLNVSKFTINADGASDLATEQETIGQIFAIMMPMLMFALLASSCMAVAPESIAGEKERGTMATVLITPVKRWQIALGKIISLSCFAILSGISSFIGVILSLPKLMTGIIGAEAAAFYSAGDYFMIFALIISIVISIISLFSVLSAAAKSVKEASSMIGPAMIVIILLGMASMFITGTPATALYAVPVMGSALAIASIMSFTASGLAVALAVVSNLALAAALIALLAFMFCSERVMFNK